MPRARRNFVNQRKYAIEILEDFGLLCFKPMISIKQYLKLSKDEGQLVKDLPQFKRVIERLLYLIMAWPDITYLVHHLSQFLDQTREPNMRAALRIFQYIRFTW